MALRAGRRTADITHIRGSTPLALRRAALGGAMLTVAGALGALVGGWAWAFSALLAIPGLTTLAAARHRYVAPCPGCGAVLGGGVFVGPDEPVIARGALDHRCSDCGIYVDVVRGAVREAPFGRVSELPSYGATLPVEALPRLAWGDRCVACGEGRTVGLAFDGTRELGLLLEGARPTDDGAVPLCDAHRDGAERWIVLARNGTRVTVQFSSYASYRSFLDANRGCLELNVREVAPTQA